MFCSVQKKVYLLLLLKNVFDVKRNARNVESFYRSNVVALVSIIIIFTMIYKCHER